MSIRSSLSSSARWGSLVGLVLAWTLPMAQADIAIKPAYVEVALDARTPSGRFIISNLGDTEERYRVNALFFVYSEHGAFQQLETGPWSLAEWIHFNPKELTLPPKSQQAVRFAIVPRSPLEPGEYWAAMELESLRINEALSTDPNTGKTVKIKMLSTIVVPIFGSAGTVRYEGQIKEAGISVENGEVMLNALVAATGTGRLGLIGKYQILNATGQVVDEGPYTMAYVLRESQKWLSKKIDKPLSPGTYLVKMVLEDMHLKPPLETQFQVNWPVLTPASMDPCAPGNLVKTSDPNQAKLKDGPAATLPTEGTHP